MSSLNWSQVGEAFDQLAKLPAQARTARLEEIAARDPRLASELKSLLAAHDSAEGFFEEKVPRLFGSLAPNISLAAGEKLLHFEITEFLGEGSSARVYLGRDLELERLVALKVTLSESCEARTLAAFNIDGIVQVHSEHVVEREGVLLRLMCLQFIAGPTLSSFAQVMKVNQDKSFIQILEMCSRKEAVFDPSSLQWRASLAKVGLTEAVVLLGMRLAEILGHAHARGILHLDIKPANILIDPYGSPFVSDFNVSAFSSKLAAGETDGLGGTPRYMPPEQKRFFETKNQNDALKLDARTDVYALAIVLLELLPQAPASLKQILERAAHANQSERFATAKDFQIELGGWLRAHLSEQEMPKLWKGTRWIVKRPMLGLIGLTVLSQMVASVINISYNHLQIVGALTTSQNEVFMRWVGIYNVITYPFAVGCAAYAMRALFSQDAPHAQARRTALRVPVIMFSVITFGWLPGAWIFPRVIDHYAGPTSANIYGQFAMSFSLGWLISMTTSIAVSLFVLTRALYPRYWKGDTDLAERELAPAEWLNRSLTFLAALVPMSGVLMVASMAPEDYSAEDYRAFKILILATVGFGLINLFVVERLTQVVDKSLKSLKRPRSFG